MFCVFFSFVLLVHIPAMFFTIIKPGKLLLTNVTRIRFFSCVFSHVDSQIGSLWKRYVANLTLKWFYSFMYSFHVCSQCTSLNKSLSTFVTEEIFHSSVGSKVSLQLMSEWKAFAANVTGVENQRVLLAAIYIEFIIKIKWKSLDVCFSIANQTRF